MQYYQEAIALGSKTGISLVSSADSHKVELIFKKLWRTIFQFERQFSRFLPSSELSIFNRNAGLNQSISSGFRDLLIAAKQMSDLSDGLYNPFVLPAVQLAGYRSSRVPEHENDLTDDFSKRSVASFDQLDIGEDWAKIPYDTALDMGGCGKGYLADRLTQAISAEISGYWISLGGDIVASGRDAHNKPWKVSVEDALNNKRQVATYLAESTCGVATSGITVNGGHIIDPRTRLPAVTDVLLATVCDDSCLRADVLASCVVILGAKDGLDFLKAKGAKAAVIQYQAKAKMQNVMHFGNVKIVRK